MRLLACLWCALLIASPGCAGQRLVDKPSFDAHGLHNAISSSSLTEVNRILTQAPKLVNQRRTWRSPHKPSLGDSYTPLHTATRGDAAMVTLLLNRGAAIDATMGFDRTPLYLACQWGNLEVVDTLLRYGANVNASDEFGSTPIHVAARLGHLQITRLLLEHGAKVGLKDKKGLLPIDHARKFSAQLQKALVTSQ